MPVPKTILLFALTGAAATQAAAVERRAVLEHYADIAHAVYADSLVAARDLEVRVDGLLAQPAPETLDAARDAWVAARVPYQQSEVFRFGNALVDAWEPQVNAWPLDEGLIDYVSDGYQPQLGNPGGQLNIIASRSVELGRTTLDLTGLDPELLAGLNELAGSEANVATGYHAIEFLLWGQDLNGTGPGAGSRPYTDYVTGESCTHGHCRRRGEYLRAVTSLLIRDLEEMTGQWAPGEVDNYRAALLALDGDEGLVRMIYGMGSLALGELAGERMKVALAASSPEDEHDCFSDNTHWSHYYNGLGIRNVYRGEYERIDGSTVSGPSLADYVAERDPAAAGAARESFAKTQRALDAMVTAAGNGMKFDQMIAEDNAAGRALVNDAIDALVAETDALVRAAAAIGIDNLNPDDADHEF